jgi:hypothetical protein
MPAFTEHTLDMLKMNHRILGRILTIAIEILETPHITETTWYSFVGCFPFLGWSFQPQVAPAPASAVDAGGKTGHHFSNLGEMLEITKMPTNLVLGCPIGIGIVVNIWKSLW